MAMQVTDCTPEYLKRQGMIHLEVKVTCGVSASAIKPRTVDGGNWTVFPVFGEPFVMDGTSGWAYCDMVYHLRCMILKALIIDVVELERI